MSKKIEQTSFFEKIENKTGPVTCLGLVFDNEDERRRYFREELRKKLPELKEMEGYPMGEDEDIIELSDPPFFTVCPNPWINKIIDEWNKNKKENQNSLAFKREPFVADVSEGKNDPIYNAHSYHTKVPHKAIMRYILHYTNPGDTVFDGFAGTGMTGVAAQLCGNEKSIIDLGYTLRNNSIINEEGNEVSQIGKRNAIISDLSPIAGFISNNYNTPLETEGFKNEALRLLEELDEELGWMYQTNHTENGKENVGKINYVVWSEVFLCPHCSKEFNFFDVAVDYEKGKVYDEFDCPECKATLNKRKAEKSFNSKFDSTLDKVIEQVKEVPVLINYTYGKKKHFKKPDSNDLAILNRIEEDVIHDWYPSNRMPEGDESRRNDRTGKTHIHHLYTKRNLFLLSTLREKFNNSKLKQALLLLFTSHLINLSKLNRFRPGVSFPYNPLSGTLYIASQTSEANIIDAYRNKVNRIVNAFYMNERTTFTGINSLVKTEIKDNTIDYIFTDPPFGANIMYSELSFIWESWLKITTSNNTEAIINQTQNKSIDSYQTLMEQCFSEYYRVLKPGRWITIEFSNSKASVWNSIQEAIQRAGFIIANVSALDKQQGSFKAVTTTTAVKQDLIISAYKPSKESIDIINESLNSPASTWHFINQHLEKLPIFIGNKGNADLIVERTPRILFDRMVAYHVQNGLPVPVSSGDFQLTIMRNFPMRDGMVFLENQVVEYDKKRIVVKDFNQLSWLVTDENSAIEWIRQKLMHKPQTRQDLHPNFMKEIQHIAKHELLPELDSLLEQNFLMYEGKEEVPSQIHGYISSNYKDLRGLQKTDSRLKEKAKNRWYVPDPNKQADLEKLREKSLLREFDSYQVEIEGNKKKLKQFRTEAIRTGFKKAWSEKDYETIVKIGERLPEKVLQEDDKLLMYFDNAQIRLGV